MFPERAKLKGGRLISFDAEQIFMANVHDHFQDIGEIYKRFPFDAFCCDDALYAARLVAAKLQPRAYSVGPGPVMATSRDVPPPFFGLRPAKSVARKLIHRGIRALLNSSLKGSTRRYNEALTSEGLAPIESKEFFDVPYQSAKRFFQIGSPGLDYPRSDLPANVTFVGPLLPYKKAPSAEFAHLGRRLSSDPSVIVVSQGTVDNHDPDKLMVPALEALKGGPHLLVVTTGGQHTKELRRRYPQDNVVIEDFLDFDALFPHTRAFICNGGHGSVMLALCHGVPILAAGQREGKNDINARLDYLGLGIDLRTERPTPDKIARGLERLVNDTAVRQNISRVRAELASYRPFEIIDGYLAEDAEPSTGNASAVA